MDKHDSDVLADVGHRLRALRRGHTLTLPELATITGMSVSTLSRLETGRLRPTLGQLLPLARAYGATLDDLAGITEPADPRNHLPVIHRHGAAFIPLTLRAGGVRAYKMISPARDTLPVPDPCRHEGYQWLYVLSGRLRVMLGNQDFVLKPGEAAEFDTGVPHWMGHADHDPIELLMLFGPQGERAKLIARTPARKAEPSRENRVR
jgi:transcriptional regulator with XRE-family HTH domain